MTGAPLLKASRLDKGLNIPQAAKAIGVTTDILQRAENGAQPRPKAAKRIADFYELRVTEIWPVEELAA